MIEENSLEINNLDPLGLPVETYVPPSTPEELDEGGDPFRSFVGTSESVMRIKQLIRKISDSELSVLIRGESGTGKEIVARIMHQLSSRRRGPFVKVNCAALSESLLESELFGHEKGAFTGAHKSRPGRFELAHRGTIFLDEIGDMAYNLQAKSLQVLEQKEFMPVGSNRTVRVDVRILSATNGILEEFIENRAFRKDLLYRLNDVTITLPPLRERKEDVFPLIEYFLEVYAGKYRRPSVTIPPEEMDLMAAYDWPGNIRQLESLVKKMTILGDDNMVRAAIQSECQRFTRPPELTKTDIAAPASPSNETPEPAPAEVSPQSLLEPKAEIGDGSTKTIPSTPYETDEIQPLKEATSKAIRETEIRLLSRALTRTRWNRREASKLLKISYRSLLYKIKEYDLMDPRNRVEA